MSRWSSRRYLALRGKKQNGTCSRCISKAGRFYGAECGNARSSTSSNCMGTCCSLRSNGQADMEIRRQENCIEISELDPFLAELLRQVPESTNTDGVEAAQQRLFSSPAPASEREICAEWKLYVEPELRRLSQTATKTVAVDLQQLNSSTTP